MGGGALLPTTTRRYLVFDLLDFNLRAMLSSLKRIDRHCKALAISRRHISTGNSSIDSVINRLSSSVKINEWTKRFEDFAGLTEVKEAQNEVNEAQKRFDAARHEVGKSKEELEAIQQELRVLRGKLDRVAREDPKYLELATEEHRILQTEVQVKDWSRRREVAEREQWDSFTWAVRDSQEKERARVERTKYWTVIISGVCTVIGVAGSLAANHARMKKLQGLVLEMSALNQEERARVEGQVEGIKGWLGEAGVKFDLQTESMEELLKEQTRMGGDLEAIKRCVQTSRPPEELLDTAEQRFEFQVKMNALATVTFVYAAFALTLPILYSIFK